MGGTTVARLVQMQARQRPVSGCMGQAREQSPHALKRKDIHTDIQASTHEAAQSKEKGRPTCKPVSGAGQAVVLVWRWWAVSALVRWWFWSGGGSG